MDAVLNCMAFYSHRRLDSTLGYVSPMHYEDRWYVAQRKKLHESWAKSYPIQGLGQSIPRPRTSRGHVKSVRWTAL
ncbi:MAG: hypothetical protein RL392_1236 [Pseudomonadota bacterium]|jgi:hypothetical protein